MSAIPRVTIRFLRCSVTFRLAIILNNKPSHFVGSFWHRIIGLDYPKINFTWRCITPMMKPLIFGITWWACLPSASSVLVIIKAVNTNRITFGQWVTQVLVVLVPKYFMTTASIFGAVCQVHLKKTATVLSRFGTTSLCSLTAKKTAHLKNCLHQVSIRAWGLSVLVPSCKACIATMKSIYLPISCSTRRKWLACQTISIYSLSHHSKCLLTISARFPS